LRILVVGAGVIGSVYAGHLAEAGHDVTLLARGGRLEDLRRSGLRLRRPPWRERTPALAVAGEVPGAPLDLVVVTVRREQAAAALAQVSHAPAATVLLFGNYAGLTASLADAAGPGQAVLAGFPGAGGRIDGDTVTYSLIAQQPTVVGATGGGPLEGPRVIAGVLYGAGFRTRVQADVEGWLGSHAALVVPMAAAIRAAGGRAEALGRRRDLLRSAIRATRASYRAQRRLGRLVIPSNLRVLYLAMPEWFAVRYWSAVLRGELGELAFAAHTRHAWPEMAVLGAWLRGTVAGDADAAAALDRVLELAADAG
jgi:2-dehydropantoate 2-reductase